MLIFKNIYIFCQNSFFENCLPDKGEGKFIRFGGGWHPLALEDFESKSFWENVLFFSEVCLSHSLSVVLLTSLFIFLGSYLVSLGFLVFLWDVC